MKDLLDKISLGTTYAQDGAFYSAARVLEDVVDQLRNRQDTLNRAMGMETEPRADMATARRLLAAAGGLIDEALTQHIYDDGDEVPEDCGYTACSAEIEAFLAGSPVAEEPIRILVHVNQGMVEEIVSDRELPNVSVVVVDFDLQDTDGFDVLEVRDWEPDGEESVSWRPAGVNVCGVGRREGLDWATGFRIPEVDQVVDLFAPDMPREMADLLLSNDLEKLTVDQMQEAFNGARADREGWGVFLSDSRGWEIEATDHGPFCRHGSCYDEEAVEFVKQCAEAGSPYHGYAIVLHNKTLAEHRAKALKLGYRVVETEAGPWRFDIPMGGDGGFPYSTEAAAWTGAFMDAGERDLLEDE